ncbi:hypothetical protein SISSUDRAFT_997473 [Sistotremastrum suecicum HHB10207 ss-3]|uniref:Uncharacterized protein n=1 Tax=Sistotremastrum suecicum HHB10207 ss-3 TaxID=1314776 RepID=A0A166I180_9AGAM|nr:hypothetical protein SISSUDRAFT_997473 [Sistotremastrum suecicum HHB10207 ss-3]
MAPADESTYRYLNDFSKALASEVRILLAEVGKLRDERRALQYEIAELMAVKSKHGAGGEYSPDWKPKVEAPPPPAPEPAPAAIEGIPPAKPAWRTVHKRPERKPKEPKAIAAAPAPPPPPVPAVEPAKQPAWSTWKPNPLLAPTPKLATVAAPLPTPRPAGLFGNDGPEDKLRR